jgi:uncharacterized membrane protein YedE/YeeE
MEFSCFEGGWDSQGLCVSGSRVGHIPTFPIVSVAEDNNDEFIMALVIGLAAGVVFALLLSLCMILFCCSADPAEPETTTKTTLLPPVASTTNLHAETALPEATIPRQDDASLPVDL